MSDFGDERRTAHYLSGEFLCLPTCDPVRAMRKESASFTHTRWPPHLPIEQVVPGMLTPWGTTKWAATGGGLS